MDFKMYKLTADKKFFYHIQKIFWYHGRKIEKTIYRDVKNKHHFYYAYFFSDNRGNFILSRKKYVIKYFKNPKEFIKKNFGSV